MNNKSHSRSGGPVGSVDRWMSPVQRRAIVVLVAVTMIAACSSPSLAPTPTPAATATPLSPTESATAVDPATATTTPSPTASAVPPTFDPGDPSTLVGVWAMAGWGQFTLNDAGYFGVVNADTGERLDNGTWELTDGVLRLDSLSPTDCVAMVAEYAVAAGDEPGELTLEPQQDACGPRSLALREGLTWIGPDD